MSMRLVVVIVLMLVLMASAIGVVYARHEGRMHFIELNQLNSERDNLNFEFGRLQLEQATWAENNRIEQIARGRLGMVAPGTTEMIETTR